MDRARMEQNMVKLVLYCCSHNGISEEYPIELEVLQKKGSRYTCSYDEEKAAMNLALD